jgi:hypothetical protein
MTSTMTLLCHGWIGFLLTVSIKVLILIGRRSLLCRGVSYAESRKERDIPWREASSWTTA